MKKLLLLLPLFMMLSGFTFPEDKHLVDRNNLEKTQTEIATNFKIDNLWYPSDTKGAVHERYSIASYSMDKSKGQFMIFIRGDLNGKYTSSLPCPACSYNGWRNASPARRAPSAVASTWPCRP